MILFKPWVCVGTLDRDPRRKERRQGRWRRLRRGPPCTASRPSGRPRRGRRRRGPRRSRPLGCGPNRWGRSPGWSGPSNLQRTPPETDPWSPPGAGRKSNHIRDQTRRGVGNEEKDAGREDKVLVDGVIGGGVAAAATAFMGDPWWEDSTKRNRKGTWLAK